MILKLDNLKNFCKKARFNNQLEAIDLVSEEIRALKMANKKNTGIRKLEAGSREEMYYEDLMTLMRILVNTSLPEDLRPGFLQDIFPMVLRLYKTNSLMGKIIKRIVREDIQWQIFKAQGIDN